MKIKSVRKCAGALVMFCGIGLLTGCSASQAGQGTGDAGDVAELPGGAYVSDVEDESIGGADDGIEEADVQATDSQLNEEPSQTADADRPDEDLSNHVTEEFAIDADITSSLDPAGSMICLIDDSVFDNLHTDADASTVENSYVLGDWSRITKEALQGIWYHHPKDMGDSKECDVVLQFDGEDAIVYYPAVDFYGEARYEWDVVDRSDRGLCSELAIYWRGTHDGELAWYILGISDAEDYFWCNGEVFYKQ